MLALTQEPVQGALRELPPHQKFVAIALAVIILGVVIELVRRRKLREEYSVLWIGTALLLLALALQPRLLNLFQAAIGAHSPIPAFFFGGLMFLMLVSLMVSLRLSRLSFRNKRLSQRVSLQQREMEELMAKVAQLERDLGGARPQPENPGPVDDDLDRGASKDVPKDGAA